MIEAEIQKVCVIGAGTMGGGIAAHLANLGFDVTLLDATHADAIKGLERLRQARPPAFYVPEHAGEIRLGSVAENLYWAGEADWICEAIVENAEAKQTLFARLEPLLKPKALISSNTSGIPLSTLAAGRTLDFQKRFLGIHFFNPPRYLKLIELIPTLSTDPSVVQAATQFLETKVARRVVLAKDVPGFIANRFGMWSLFHGIRVAEKLGLSVEEVDLITGVFLGRPKSGTFRLADVIGLDVMRAIGNNLKESLPQDPATAIYEPSGSMLSLLARGWIGDKMGHGYYRREGKETLILDLQTMAYRMSREPSFPDIARLSSMPLVERIKEALTMRSEVGEYTRECLIPTLRYADELGQKVSHSVSDFDRVMKWGFGWELGPFELIDAIGGEKLGISNSHNWYQGQEVRQFAGGFQRMPDEPEFKSLSEFKEIAAGQTFKLRDLGNGVVAVVLTSKMGVISPLMISELTAVFEEKIQHYVLCSEARSFSAGFDLQFFNEAIGQEDLGRIAEELRALQNLGELMEKKAGSAAVYGHCLGAGLELALSTNKILAAAETQIGLPESRVGLLPGGRGVALMRLNNSFNAKRLAEVALTLTQGTIAPNADVARQLGYLRSTDVTVYNPDQLIFLAKQAALDAKPAERPAWSAALGPLVGMIDEGISKLRAGGTLTEYDEVIGGKIRQIMARSTGYEDALTRERAEFMDLCNRALTHTRIKHMLESGKPLRN